MSNETPLNPDARARRADVEGVAVKLCDGNVWTFHRPVVEGYRFTQDTDGKTVMARSFQSAAYEAIFDELLETDDLVEHECKLFDLAYSLLASNYEVTRREASRLMRLLRGDPDNDRMWEEIRMLVAGAEKKAGAVG